MALSSEDKEKAKQQAKEYLEFSVYTLSLLLGVEPDLVSAEMEIPVDKAVDPRTHRAFECLIEQKKNLDKLVG